MEAEYDKLLKLINEDESSSQKDVYEKLMAQEKKVLDVVNRVAEAKSKDDKRDNPSVLNSSIL